MSLRKSQIMNIPQGYKQTELGIIPEDWEVVNFCEVADNFTGLTYAPENVKNYGTLVLRSSNIQDGFLCYEDNVYVDGINIPDRAKAKAGDILVCVRNGSRNLIGKSALISSKAPKNLAFGAFMTVLRAKNGSHNIFIHQIWQSDYIQRQIKDNLGATINQVTNKDISRYIIPMPPIAEQRAIAEALSDVDGLIAALDKKIVKKRLLKQGAMCKLLSLSGRGKKWFNVRLGNVVNIRKGSMLTSDKFVAGNIPVIAGGKIPAGYHNVANRPANTITISASGASAGYVALYNKPIFATDCSTIEPCSTYDIHYIYHLLKYYQSEIFAMQTGGAQPHVHPSDLNELQILYAKDIEEQRAIATILSDMDKGIADLEAKRDKYRLLKSGMMQKLLTGQIRLKNNL